MLSGGTQLSTDTISTFLDVLLQFSAISTPLKTPEEGLLGFCNGDAHVKQFCKTPNNQANFFKNPKQSAV